MLIKTQILNLVFHFSRRCKQRFWKRILIIDDDLDVIITLKAGMEDSNINNDANKRIEV
ncbi:MAG: hypothetical protein WAM14_00440 [Candidatus Nitrosopolaris sp.]